MKETFTKPECHAKRWSLILIFVASFLPALIMGVVTRHREERTIIFVILHGLIFEQPLLVLKCIKI